MAFWAIFRGFGLLFYLLLGFRYGLRFRVRGTHLLRQSQLSLRVGHQVLDSNKQVQLTAKFLPAAMTFVAQKKASVLLLIISISSTIAIVIH